MNRKYISNLDLLISTMSCADKVNYHIGDDTLGSDHFPIFFNVNTDKYIYKKKRTI